MIFVSFRFVLFRSRGYSKRFTFAFYVSIKFLPFCRCTTSTCIIQFTQTSMYVKSINFIVYRVLKGAAPTSFSTRCKRVPRQIKCDKLFACPALLSFYRTKSTSQTRPYPLSFPVWSFFFSFFHRTHNNVELGKGGKVRRRGMEDRSGS